MTVTLILILVEAQWLQLQFGKKPEKETTVIGDQRKNLEHPDDGTAKTTNNT